MKNKISYQTEEAILITQHISIPQQDVDLMYTLITGSGSGIGKALAEECAKRSMNILLVALPGDDLAETENSIRANYKVQCHSLAIDLSQPCTLQKVHEWVKQNNYRVNILINNVGVGSKGAFEKLSPDFYITQLNLNVTATCLLTRLFVDELKANAPSHILNVGSMGGFFMLPEKAVYTASKAFIYSFSRTLRMELKDQNINVSVVCPGGTDSNPNTTSINSKLKGPAKISILQPQQVAHEAISGLLKKQPRIIPGFFNKIYYHLSRMAPEFVKNFFISNAFKHVKKHEY